MTGDWFAFSRMRGDDGRTWLRSSDLIAAMAAEGFTVTRWIINKATRGLPRPIKRYGHYRYTNEHMEAVRAYAARMGFTKETANV